ncbi:MAG: hypothetical protein M3165_02600, partial [Actinomycetota bacterium]|nr:hypothetical protein [Actinomycetota bacterium]
MPPERSSRAPAKTASPPGPGRLRTRARLARLGGGRQSSLNPVLEPLFRIVRGTHPKADLAIIERAYLTAERHHQGQLR